MNRHARPVGRTSQARSNRNLAASTPDFRLRPTIVGLALVAVVMMAPSAEAATRTWNGNISSDWLTGGNWSSGAVPTASDFIYINSSSPRAASLTGTTAALVVALGNPVGSQGALTVQSGTGKLSLGSQLQIGLSGKGEVSILQGGSIAANSAVAVGVSKGSQGTLNADGAGSALTTKTQVQIGVSGSGTVTVSNSAQATVGTDMLIGVNANSEGKIQISGTGSTVGVGNFLQVGKSGRGALDVSNGGTLKTGGPAILGGDAIGHGTVTLSDDGTQMTTGQLLVGSAGTGELTVGKGAKFTTTDDAHVGDSIGSSGTVTVTGSGSAMSVAGDIGVGEDGAGELSIQDGASVVTGASATSYGDLYIGENKDGSGTVLVEGQSGGVGSTLTVKGQITVGSSGNGAMTVSNGGVANAGDSIFVGASTGGTGALTVADAGSRLTTGGDLQVGSVATGSMTVTDGAKVSVDRDAYVGLYSGADGTLTVTRAATFDVLTGTTNVGDSGTGRMTVSNGGRLNTIDVLIGNQVDGKGDVTVSDAGSRISALRDLVVGGKGRGTLSVNIPYNADVAGSLGPVGFYYDTTIDPTYGFTVTQPSGIGLTSAQMTSRASYAALGWDFTNDWAMYEGHTAPLLRTFMAPLTLSAAIAPTKVYDGRVDAGTVVYSAPADPSHLFGAPTLGGVGRNVGIYTATPTGVWSDQQGYLITFVGATTTVTPATLVVTAAGGTQVYDGTRNATVSLSSIGVA